MIIGTHIGIPGDPGAGGAQAPSLGLLHDFDPTVNVTLAAGVVSSWQSRVSSAVVAQGTAGFRPAPAVAASFFSGRQTIDFDAADDFLTGAFTIPVPCFVALAWRLRTTAACSILDGFTANRCRIQQLDSTHLQFGVAGPVFFSGAMASTQVPHVVGFDIQLAVANGRVDGVQIATSGAASPTTPAGLTFGAIGGGSSDWAALSLARALVYDASVGGFDKTVPELFLKAVYGTP